MTQEEFDRIMQAKEERERATSDMVRVTFENENMILLNLDGYNYDGVNFVHCILPEISLSKTAVRFAPPHFVHCEIRRIWSDEGDTTAFLWNTTVQNVHIEGGDFVNFSAQRSRIGDNFILAGRHVEVSLHNMVINNELSLSDTNLDLSISGSTICNGLHLSNCTGSADLAHCNIQDITFPQPNRLKYLRVSNTTFMNRLNLEPWPVEYCADMMRIGCQQHSLEEWENFTDEQIFHMDEGALEWWAEWKEPLLSIVKASNRDLPSLCDQIEKPKED